MKMNAPTPPYPTAALPLELEQVIREVQLKVQAPEAMIAMATLGVVSTSCHGLVDVRLPTGQLRPVTLNILNIAESGERKTSVDNILSAPIYAADEARAAKYTSDLSHYRRDMRVWTAMGEIHRAGFKNAVKSGDPTEQIKLEWDKHIDSKPLKPRLRQTVRNDITERALLDVLEGDGEAVVLATDEGEAVLKASGMANFSVHNRAWDGAKMLTLDRGGNKHVVARNPREGMNIMVQPAIFEAYLRRHGELARGSGFWARVLVGAPASMQGFRFVYWYNEEWHHLPGFHDRIKELMDEYDRRIAEGPVQREVVEFSPEAVSLWIQFSNELEGMIHPTGGLSDIKDFASKALEITGRIAALLHYFSKQGGPITGHVLRCASAIIAWHIDEFKRLFGSHAAASQLQDDAKALAFYINTQFVSNGNVPVPRNHVLRNGPMRPASRFNEVLDYLIMCGRVQIACYNRRRFICSGPNFGAPWY